MSITQRGTPYRPRDTAEMRRLGLAVSGHVEAAIKRMLSERYLTRTKTTPITTIAFLERWTIDGMIRRETEVDDHA